MQPAGAAAITTWHGPCCCWVVATRVPVMSHLTGENLLQYKSIHVHGAKKSTRVLVYPFVQFCSRSMTRMTCWRTIWKSSWLNTEQAEPFTNRLQSKILLPMGEYWVLYNKWTLSPQLWSQKFRPWSISAGGTPTSVLLFDGCNVLCTQTEFSDVFRLVDHPVFKTNLKVTGFTLLSTH